LGTTFGRGGATTFQQDLQNADCIVIEGSNMAECHPVGFQWVMEAKARGATIIHVDPRFTRTSAVADLHVPIRAGSDIAFLGGLVNYVLSGGHEFHDYLIAYTFMKDQDQYTLPVWLASFSTPITGTDFGGQMAGSVIFSLPVVVFFLIIQRKLVSGVSAGAVKG